MKKNILLLILSASITLAGNRIPIPDKQISYNSEDVISNPVTGEKLVYNQMLIVFDPSVNRQIQESILEGINAVVVGGLPSFDIYQVTFDNPDRTFSKLAQVQLKLEKNEKIIFAMPQKVNGQNSNKTKELITTSSSDREGSLNSKNINRKLANKSKRSIQDVINGHYPGLYACVEKQNRVSDSFHGKIGFELIVNPNGSVKNASITRSNIRDKIITTCMLKKIRKWRDFPKTSRNESKRIEFEFKF
jgi:hypothetical protein